MYHNICFEQKYENSQKSSTEHCHFYIRGKSLYIAWACFRNELRLCMGEIHNRRLYNKCVLKV